MMLSSSGQFDAHSTIASSCSMTPGPTKTQRWLASIGRLNTVANTWRFRCASQPFRKACSGFKLPPGDPLRCGSHSTNATKPSSANCWFSAHRPQPVVVRRSCSRAGVCLAGWRQDRRSRRTPGRRVAPSKHAIYRSLRSPVARADCPEPWLARRSASSQGS